MGLWLKCPQCQTANPLELKICAKCNVPLDNLPADQRVYILAQAPPAAPPAAAPKAAGQSAPTEGTAAAPASKRAKGAKARKKKS